MFVSKSKYQALLAELRAALRINNELAKIVVDLRRRLDARQPQFSPDEIEQLIRLCHPDKHNNSVAANSVTAKLMRMRKCKKAANTTG